LPTCTCIWCCFGWKRQPSPLATSAVKVTVTRRLTVAEELLLALVAFVAVVYAITIVKLKGS